VAIVTEVYLAREPADPEVGGREVAAEIPGGATRSLYAETLDEAADLALAEARPGDLLITMGAGDVTRLGQDLVARLQKLYPDGASSP
jgi:UDP-N-acetylmuramate--alanine ligase